MRKKLRRLLWKSLQRYAPSEVVVALKYRQALNSGRQAAFPFKNTVVTGEAPAGSILILAPHPDDEVIGPGGLLSLHLQNQDPVTILYLTDGRGGNMTDTSLVKVRRQEALAIGQRHGLRQIFWDVPDTKLSSDAETVLSLVRVLDEVQPDYLYLPSFFDRQRDHFAANQLLADALRKMEGLQAVILGYEVWDNIPYPNYVVDISSAFATKADMMRLYETAMQATNFVALFGHRNALHYSLLVDSRHRTPEGYAEAFLRFDATRFVALFDKYKEILAENHSPLLRQQGDVEKS